MCVYVYVYICIYMYIYVCIYLYIYTHAHTHKQTHTHRLGQGLTHLADAVGGDLLTLLDSFRLSTCWCVCVSVRV